jgi:hypothetical protein
MNGNPSGAVSLLIDALDGVALVDQFGKTLAQCSTRISAHQLLRSGIVELVDRRAIGERSLRLY